jgi:hypothetical protein
VHNKIKAIYFSSDIYSLAPEGAKRKFNRKSFVPKKLRKLHFSKQKLYLIVKEHFGGAMTFGILLISRTALGWKLVNRAALEWAPLSQTTQNYMTIKRTTNTLPFVIQENDH